MKSIYVPIHQFAGAMGYCEIKIINHFHLNIAPKVSKEQTIGKKVHSDLEETDKLIPREKATDEQLKDPYVDLDFPRETVFVTIDRNPFFYIGRTDKAIRSGGNIIIIDDKVSKSGKVFKSPFPDKIIQICCYCEGFLQAYTNLIPFNKIFFRIVQRDVNQNILSEYEEEYNESFRCALLDKMQRFENIYNQKIQPDHCNNPNKCRACSYFNECKWKLEI